MTRDEANALLWQAGDTSWRLPPRPLAVYNDIRAGWGQNPYVLLAHRNFWKSGVALTIADEECRRASGRLWAVILKTKDHATKVVRSLMRFLLASCPESLRPTPLRSDFSWQYPNGSQILFFGADSDHIETARGMGFDGAIFDEAGHQDNLRENLHSIILPALAKRGRGQVIMPSTPSKIPGHYFELLCEQARAAGRFAFVPASQNPDLTPEWRAARAKECGGVDSLDYRVEYECEFVADPTTTVLPSVTQARIAGTDGRPALVQPVAVRRDREWYCAMDIGGKHLTGLLWGYYEPETDSVHVAREWASRNTTGPEVARGVMATEAALWGATPPKYFERWSDNNQLGFLWELDTGHKLRFYPTRKDDKIAQLSSLRKLIEEGKLVLDPSCVLTLATFRKAQWATGLQSRGFAETPEIGHADLLDAALYLCRNVRRRPYPVQVPDMLEQARGIMGARPRSEGMRRLAETLEAN